jgi:aryl-alcohol dehydrogenase-like predicted oxidoreductase
VAAVAIAWVLGWPGVTGAIVGARSAQQVDGWIAAGTLMLSASDIDEIANAIERTDAGQGPTRPARLQTTAGAPAQSMEAR